MYRNHSMGFRILLLYIIAVIIPAMLYTANSVDKFIGSDTTYRLSVYAGMFMLSVIWIFLARNVFTHFFDRELYALVNTKYLMKGNTFDDSAANLYVKIEEELSNYATLESTKNEVQLKISEVKKQIYKVENDIARSIRVGEDLIKQASEFLDQTKKFTVVINGDGNIAYVTKAFEKRFKYTNAELIGQPIRKVIYESAGTFTVEGVTKGKIYVDNKTVDVRIKNTPIRNEHILCVVEPLIDEINVRQIFDQKMLEINHINKINESLISNISTEELLDNITDNIHKLFKAEVVAVYRKDEAGNISIQALKGTELNVNIVQAKMNKNSIFANKEYTNTSLTGLITIKNYLTFSIYNGEDSQMRLAIFTRSELRGEDIDVLQLFRNQCSIVMNRSKLFDQTRSLLVGTIEVLASMIESKDKYTEGHSKRVSEYSVLIAQEMGYPDTEIESIKISGLLHDVGKISIDNDILTKSGKLTNEEYSEIKRHPEAGFDIIKSIDLDQKIKDGVLYHHARYDLKGYPTANHLEYLPDYATIIGVADAFDAMTSLRTYSKPKTFKEALVELNREKNRQFEPMAVEALEKIILNQPEKLMKVIGEIDASHRAV